MGKPPGFDAPEGGALASFRYLAACQVIAAANGLLTGNWHEPHCLGFARFKSHRRPSGDIQALAVSNGPIKAEGAVRFDEMIVAAHLDRPVPEIGYGQLDRGPPGVELYVFLQYLHGAGLLFIRLRLEQDKVRRRKEAAVQRQGKISVL